MHNIKQVREQQAGGGVAQSLSTDSQRVQDIAAQAIVCIKTEPVAWIALH
jgi:hypothetical protein